jgi:hypothetical protein
MNNKIKLIIIIPALAVVTYLLTQLFWFFFVYFDLGITYGIDIALFDSLTTATGSLFFMLLLVTVAYRLYRSYDVAKKSSKIKTKDKATFMLTFFKKLKKTAFKVTRLVYNSRNMVLLVVAVILVTLLFSFLITSWFNNENYAINNDKLNGADSSNEANADSSNEANADSSNEADPTVPAIGGVRVEGLEIYGGDIKYNAANYSFYVDWGELTIGSYENVSFYVKSTSNVDVTIAMNVTNWQPYGIDDYITVSWDYNGTLLSPSRELFVTLTLEVASSGAFIDFLLENAFTSFSFDITVYAVGI